LQAAEQRGFVGDARRPIGVLGTIGGGCRGEVDANGVEHDKTEIATARQMGEIAMQAREQLLCRKPLRTVSLKPGQRRGQFVENWRGLRQMAEAVR